MNSANKSREIGGMTVFAVVSPHSQMCFVSREMCVFRLVDEGPFMEMGTGKEKVLVKTCDHVSVLSLGCLLVV